MFEKGYTTAVSDCQKGSTMDQEVADFAEGQDIRLYVFSFPWFNYHRRMRVYQCHSSA